ncbi:hypothetical protein TWF481_002381 [Arthrobotrys musiformis]|uniref:ubiquitinyl hydrolase 1 n=1 Tax=Arthrobotrys musiformis TaxID=47236 RepID=A0AAV9VVE9_9PEZI
MAEEASSSSSAMQEKADMKTAQELADLEKLSAQYEPDVNGPLVGELQSSKILEAEYAGADPVYVRKTAALSPKYSNYRTIRGDGNCGWRALAFGYFELLLRTGDAKVIEKEHDRITSLCSLLDSVGMADYLYEDFVDETKNLLRTIGQSPAIDNPYDDKPILEAFNNADTSNSIITHLKLLTSAYMKIYPDAYVPFLVEHPTIDDYRSAQIEPYGIQIDHLGVKALIDAIFIPADLNVEISYLDRSDSDEVNIHKFEDESTPASAKKEGQEQRTLRMLYRPGHYDLIYKNGDLAPPSLPISPKIASRASPDVRVSMMLGQEYTRNPFRSPSLVPGIPNSLNDVCGRCFPAMRSYRNHDGTVSTIQRAEKELETEAEVEPPLQTKLFRNSHYNTRHFQNDHFQPEMWGPDQIVTPKPRVRGLKRAFWKNFKH